MSECERLICGPGGGPTGFFTIFDGVGSSGAYRYIYINPIIKCGRLCIFLYVGCVMGIFFPEFPFEMGTEKEWLTVLGCMYTLGTEGGGN